jgi:GTPase
VDTGGLQDENDELLQQISMQARKAIEESDYVLFVVDGKEGMTAADQEIAAFLRKTGRPIALLVNKIDSPVRFGTDAEFHRFGFQDLIPVSAEHGLNVDEVLDILIERLNLQAKEAPEIQKGIPVVILGKPNAGKSTLINRILGEERLVTSEIPGTTRDTVDIDIWRGEDHYRFIDTAGIRKKGATKTVPDKLAVIHARKSLERAEIACILIDGKEGITHQDAVVAGYAREAGKAIILLLNKVDLLEPDERKALEMQTESKLQFIGFAPRLFISAKTGQHVPKLFPILKKVYSEYSKRITTSQLNAFFDRTLADRYVGSHKGKPIKLKYITQTRIQPPTFVLFTNAAREIHFSHRRYLENKLRREFGFEGSTIRIKIRPSSKRKSYGSV